LAIKRIIQPILERKFELKAIHVVAALLDPIMKNHLHQLGLSDTLVEEGRAKLKDYMMKVSEEEIICMDINESPERPKKIQCKQSPSTIVQSIYDDL
jgi:hypothetical protein